MPPEALHAIIDEAHKKGMRVAVHVVTLADAKAVLRLGRDYIATAIATSKSTVKPSLSSRRTMPSTLQHSMREVSTFVYAEKPAFLSDPFLLKDGNKAEMTKAGTPPLRRTCATTRAACGYKDTSRWPCEI